MTKIIVLTSTFPAEMAVGVFCKPIPINITPVQMSIHDSQSYDKTQNCIKTIVDYYRPIHIICIGTYWGKHLKQLENQFQCKISEFEFDNDNKKPSSTDTEAKAKLLTKNTTGPLKWICDLLEQQYINGSSCEVLYNFYKHQNEYIISLIDLYATSKDISGDAEALFAGILNLKLQPNADDSVSAKLFQLFSGKILLSDVLKQGYTALNVQKGIALARCKTNSKKVTITMEDGKQVVCAITNAPELTVQSHMALQKHYPDVDVTLTSAIRYNQIDHDEFSISVRSYSSSVNALDIVKLVDKTSDGRNGDPQAAGGRTRMNFLI